MSCSVACFVENFRYIFLTNFSTDNSKPIALNENFVCRNMIHFSQPTSSAVKKYPPKSLSMVEMKMWHVLLEGNQFDIRNCSFMQQNPTKHYVQMKGKLRLILHISHDCTYHVVQFCAKEFHLDTKIIVFCNLVGFVVTRHKLYHCKLRLLWNNP